MDHKLTIIIVALLSALVITNSYLSFNSAVGHTRIAELISTGILDTATLKRIEEICK